MEWEASWVDYRLEDGREHREAITYLGNNDERDQEDEHICIDSVLPDDLLERVMSYLPIASILRAGCVCRKWNEIVHSRRFLQINLSIFPQKPWYFMFTSSDEPVGCVYDPTLLKWYSFELPQIETPSWLISSSRGLICFMDNDQRSRLYVCNPITKRCRKLADPMDLNFSDYISLAMSTDRSSHSYMVSIVRSKQAQGDFAQWDITIHIYYSELNMWVDRLTETLVGWRGGDDTVISGGVLYMLIYSTRGMGWNGNRLGLVSFHLSSDSPDPTLSNTFITMPCPLTCCRLMNLEEKVVMVGGIGKQDRPGIIKGIGIWVLKGTDWEEVSRMPHKLFQGFGEFDDVFASSGFDSFVYVQSYGSPALAVFDMNLKQWKWTPKSPVTKKFPLQLFSGFCFEPRLDVLP